MDTPPSSTLRTTAVARPALSVAPGRDRFVTGSPHARHTPALPWGQLERNAARPAPTGAPAGSNTIAIIPTADLASAATAVLPFSFLPLPPSPACSPGTRAIRPAGSPVRFARGLYLAHERRDPAATSA